MVYFLSLCAQLTDGCLGFSSNCPALNNIRCEQESGGMGNSTVSELVDSGYQACCME